MKSGVQPLQSGPRLHFISYQVRLFAESNLLRFQVRFGLSV